MRDKKGTQFWIEDYKVEWIGVIGLEVILIKICWICIIYFFGFYFELFVF